MPIFERYGQPPISPIPDPDREWMENSFRWLLDAFGEEAIRNRKVLTPHHNDFPIRYNGETQTALDTLSIVAAQMEIDPESIHLEIYNQGKGAYLRGYKNADYSAGLYLGKEEDGKFHVWLEQEQLFYPEKMVATLAHELAHIKLLGEGRIEKNDESLTDMTTIVFGLGIFNANACFEFYNGDKGWGYSSQGYLKQREWGYGLALFLQLRDEPRADWIKLLTRNIRSDIAKSLNYLQNRDAEGPLSPDPQDS